LKDPTATSNNFERNDNDERTIRIERYLEIVIAIIELL
jgi:hypothetical protein